MTDKAGTFAACADTLAEMCAYYFIAGVMIMAKRGWGLHLGWILLCAAACTVFFGVQLKKPRSMLVLVVTVLALFAACMAVFLLASTTGPTFGYVFVLVIGAGMTVGLPLYHAFNRPELRGHLLHLDVLLAALVVLLLIRQAMNIDTVTIGLILITLLLTVASAVGLRMSGNGDDSQVLRAGLAALGAAGGAALIVAALSALLSHSSGATSTVLGGIGAFFRAIGMGIQNFFEWIASFIHVKETYDAIELEGEIPSVAGIESGAEMHLQVNGAAVGIAAAVIVVIIAVLLVVLLRRKKFSAAAVQAAPSGRQVERTNTPLSQLWKRFAARVHFSYLAWVHRNTPAGVLVRLERAAKKQKEPRLPGESMRHFIERMDEKGGLEGLADALDRVYYGGGAADVPVSRCREMRQYIRKAM